MNKILLQIDTCCNKGSTGRINEQIGLIAEKYGWISYIAHGARYTNPSQLKSIQIVSKLEEYLHIIETKIFDNHGLSSRIATKRFIKKVKDINPSIIHLHNIHGYYINYRILFNYLIEANIPVVWTLHDCWNFTGHCAYYSMNQCEKWMKECYNCPAKNSYPRSFIFDNSRNNFILKKNLFTKVKKLTLVPVSDWLEQEVKKSFFKDCDNVSIHTIHNGVNIEQFVSDNKSEITRAKYGIHPDVFLAIGCASKWDARKGLNDYIELSQIIPSNFKILLIGISDNDKKTLPDNILSIPKIEDINELASLYSTADVVLNLSYEETFGLTSIEGMSCGTPTIVYNSTASPELITKSTGFIVEKSDITGVLEAMNTISLNKKEYYSIECRNRCINQYDQNKKYKEYIDLYESILRKR